METLQLVGGILLIISSILIIIVVSVQDSRQSGLSVISGGTDSYLSKNKGKTMESKLVFITKVFGITFFVLTIALNLAIKYVK